jgi:hypothetical protein
MTDQPTTFHDKVIHDLDLLKGAKVGDVIRLYKQYPPDIAHIDWPMFYMPGCKPAYKTFDRISDQGWRRVK